MFKFIVRLFGLKGSFLWACRQMEKGCIVKPKNISGAVIYRFDLENQRRLEWAFERRLGNATWENAFFFMTDLFNMWEVVNPPKSSEVVDNSASRNTPKVATVK